MKKAFCAILLLLFFCSAIIHSQTPMLQVTLYGEKAGDAFGITAPAGDVNGDGYPDFIVTAPGGNYAKLYFGGPAFNPAHFVKFSKPKTIPFAKIAAGIGDINGDGYDDFAIGSLNFGDAYGRMPGKVWIYYGGATIDTNAVYEIEGKYYQDTFGSLIKPAGDVNKDGYADFLISSPYNWTNGKGYVVLVLGGKSIDNSSIKTLTNNEVSGRFGTAMEGVGDINKDGYDDFIIGSPGGQVTTGNYPGKAYIYYGSSSISTTPTYIINEVNEPYFGYSIIKGGDINGDRNADFFIASWASIRLYTSESNFIKIDKPLCTICAGLDLNKDGFDDYILGNGQAYNPSGLMTGQLDIRLGSTILDTIPKFTLYGKYHWESFGGEIQSIGDINKDGYAEFAVCMSGTYPEIIDPQNNNSIGKVEIYSFNNIVVGIEKDGNKLPSEYILKQNYPNPFNPSTIIEFVLPKEEYVSLKIFDVLGRQVSIVAEKTYQAGIHKLIFNSEGLSSGIYYYMLATQSFSGIRKMIILK